MTNLAINTTQNVNLGYRVVSVGERILAFLIDIILFSLYLYVIEVITSILGTAISDNWTVFGLQQLLLLPVMFYSLYMNILFNGRTIGKMILKMRVVRVDGYPVHWSDYLTLWMLRILDIWMFWGAVGLLSIVFSEKKQRIGGMASGTVVISTRNGVRLDHTALEELMKDYEPTFPTAINLTDKDARLIKETYRIAVSSNDFKALKALREKVAEIIEVDSKLYDRQFLDTVLKDYNYYTQDM